MYNIIVNSQLTPFVLKGTYYAKLTFRCFYMYICVSGVPPHPLSVSFDN